MPGAAFDGGIHSLGGVYGDDGTELTGRQRAFRASRQGLARAGRAALTLPAKCLMS